MELEVEIARDKIANLRVENDALRISLESISQQLEKAVIVTDEW
jgi:hypothetical protein